MFDYLLYYPITFILWVWHKVFGTVFGEAQAISWVLAIVFLTFTVRAIMFKPFVHQVRSMKKMQDFAPEIKKIQKRYANDKQRQAQAMQKLQREHGVNPLGGCLPILIQIPVFIGLNHVLRAFQIHADKDWGNYMFSPEATQQYMKADLFGSNLGQAIYNSGIMGVAEGGFHAKALPVAIPLMILASVLTHLTARHSVERQNPANASQQSAIMNKLTLWVFPVGLLVFGALIPLGLLIYFLANNAWTLMQQRVVYKKIDREEEEKKNLAVEKRGAMAPKPGQKPVQSKKKPAPGQKPVAGQKPAAGQKPVGGAQGAKKQGPNAGQNPDAAAKPSGPSSNGQSTPTPEVAGDGNSGSAGGKAGSSGSSTAGGSSKKKSGRKRR